MSIEPRLILAAGLLLASCQKHAPGPLSPDADARARATLQESIDNYVKTAPRKRELSLVLNPRMEVLQGNPDDPVPANVGILQATTDAPRTGLDAYSPIIVKAVQVRLRDTLQREPTPDEVINEIVTVENKQVTDISDQLQARHDEIAAIYADIARLNQQGKTGEAQQRLADLRTLRASTIGAWYSQNGVAPGTADGSLEAVTPQQAAAANRELLITYLSNGVTDSQ